MSASATSGLAAPFPVQSWYLVGRSAEVRRGAVLSRPFLGRPIVLFREHSGAVRALSAHCSHMGTHLGKGVVVGDHLRCPLHHWEYDGQGICRRIPGRDRPPENARQFSYPVAERYGGVFLFNGPAPLFPPPALGSMAETDLRIGHGRTARLRCHWTAVAANTFDTRHVETLHARAFRDAPRVEVLDNHCIRLGFVSRVTGRGAFDRTMRWLSRDRIVVTITCWGGSVVTVESDIGRARSAMLLGLMPTEAGVEVSLIFGIPRTRLAALDAFRAALARRLFSHFIQRDVEVLDGMEFRPRLCLPEDETLRQLLDFLSTLPVGRETPGRAAVPS